MMKIRPAYRSLLVAGVTILGSVFAIANEGVTTGFFALDWLTILGLSTWTSANMLNFFYRYQARKENMEIHDLIESQTSNNNKIKPSTYLTITSALQMVAATSFIGHDLLDESDSIIGIRISGSFFWLGNALLSCLIAQKFLPHLEKTPPSKTTLCNLDIHSYNLVGESFNQTGAALYIAYACALWGKGNFMPLKIGANLCWSLGASHDLALAYYAKKQENTETPPRLSFFSTQTQAINTDPTLPGSLNLSITP